MHSHGYNVAHSNNSINENKYNNEKLMKSSPVYKLKKILKPIAALLKSKKQSKKQEQSYYIAEPSFVPDYEYDNSENERLESQLLAEISECHTNAAIYVYEDQQVQILPVQPEEQFVPVHFARTEAGTFFWTTVSREADSDLVQPCQCYSDHQLPQQEFCDRWAQA